jgi:hypothetical protein
MSNGGRGDQAVGGISVRERLALGKNRNLRRNRQHADRPCGDDVLDELRRVGSGVDTSPGDQQGDLPQADVARCQRAGVALEGSSRPSRQAFRLQGVVDQDVGVKYDQTRLPSARRTDS